MSLECFSGHMLYPLQVGLMGRDFQSLCQLVSCYVNLVAFLLAHYFPAMERQRSQGPSVLQGHTTLLLLGVFTYSRVYYLVTGL